MATVNDRVGLLAWEMDLDLAKFNAKTKQGVRSLNKLDAQGSKGLKNVEKGFGRSTLAAGLFTVSLSALTSKGLEVAKAYDKIDNSMRTVFGSGAIKEMEFVTNAADNLGLSIRRVGLEYAKTAAAARGTAVEGEGVKDIFLGVSEASTALSLSQDEAAGAFRAINQIISKGKVQAEELRGQLGERIPGAFQIAARAMGVTTMELDKMMERGELLSDEFIPKFSKQLRKEFGGAAKDAANSIEANSNRMQNSWDKALRGMGSMAAKTFPFITGTLDRFNLGLEEANAQLQKLTGSGAFNVDAQNFQDSAKRLDIARALSNSAKERLGLLGKTDHQIAIMLKKDGERFVFNQKLVKEAQKEADIRKAEAARIAAEAKRVAGLKGFQDLKAEKEREMTAKKIAEAAGLTKEEFAAMSPAIEKALKDEVKFVDIVEQAKKSAIELKEAIHPSKSIFDVMRESIGGAIPQINEAGKKLDEILSKIKQDKIDAIKAQMSSLDPRTTATRATAGTLAEFRLLNDAQREKEIAKNTKRMADALEKLEAV